MADGLLPSIRDFVRSINDRKEEHRIDDALRGGNYLNDPQGAIDAVFQIDPKTGIALRDQETTRRTAAEEQRRKRTKENTDTFARYLRGAKPGSDYGSLVDQLTPFFKTSLGAGDDEIAAFRQAVTADPGILAGLDDEAFKDISKDRYSNTVLTPGSRALRGGEVVASAPFAPRPVTLRSADGNSELHVFDPNAYTGESPMPQGAPRGVAPNAPAAAPPGGGLGDDEAAQILGDAMQNKVIGESDARVIRDSLGAQGGAKYNQWLKENGIRVVPDATAARAPVAPPALPTERVQPAPPMRAAPGGPIARTTGVKPVKQTRAATPQELAAAGYPQGTAAQVDQDGKFTNLRTPPASSRPKPIDPQKERQRVAGVQSNIDTIVSIRSRIKRLMTHPGGEAATGWLAGRLPAIGQQAENFRKLKDSVADANVVQTVKNLKMESPNGATGFGALTEREGARLENLYGSLSNTNDMAELKRTLREIDSIYAKAEQRARALLKPATPAAPQGQRAGRATMGQTATDRATGRKIILDNGGWVWMDTGLPYRPGKKK